MLALSKKKPKQANRKTLSIIYAFKYIVLGNTPWNEGVGVFTCFGSGLLIRYA